MATWERIVSRLESNQKKLKDNNRKAINSLKGMLSWSDRIGSDEIDEINKIINCLSDEV